MKNFNYLISILFIALMVTSCMSMRVGYCNTNDDLKYKGGESSIVLDDVSLKSSSKSTSSSSNASNSLIISETGSTSGFYIGVRFEDVEIDEKIEFRPGANFIIAKDINQIHAPLVVSYEFAEKFNVFAGPSLGLLLDAPEGIKSFNFGADFGLSYDISDKIYLSAEYNLGLSDLSESDFSEVKVDNLMIGFGYKL